MVRRRGLAIKGDQPLRRQRGTATNATAVLTTSQLNLAVRMSSTAVNATIPGVITAGRSKCDPSHSLTKVLAERIFKL